MVAHGWPGPSSCGGGGMTWEAPAVAGAFNVKATVTACVCGCVHARMRMYMHVHACFEECVCACLCMCLCAHIRTHIRAWPGSQLANHLGVGAPAEASVPPTRHQYNVHILVHWEGNVMAKLVL